MTVIRPRLNDFHNIPFKQEDVDFAIPFLDEDIPLYVDPFLLWKMPSMQDNSLHSLVVSSFNHLGHLFSRGNELDAIKTLIELTECSEVGLGNSATRSGKKIGERAGREILSLFTRIPQVNKNGFFHFEEIQLLVDGISRDRISDISCSLIKSFLIDFTIQQCQKYNIPIEKCEVNLYDHKKLSIVLEKTYLPVNPNNNQPIILVPKRWLKFVPWINYDDYFDNYYIKDINKVYDGKLKRIDILDFNRHNYDMVSAYTSLRERSADNLKNDPLFSQIPVLSAKKKYKTIESLLTGKTDNADKRYEDNMVQLLSSMLYPHLDFAAEQSRTESGTQIRDLIFYNNRSVEFLQEIYDQYESKQLVIELKNVATVEREHINQLNRYLAQHFGRFGILFTRKRPPKNILQNTIDLWSGQRRCIIIMDDVDLQQMVEVYDSKQRMPLEIIKKKYLEFIRKCPS